MAVVFLCPWLHFRPKHPLLCFLEHFWALPELEGLLGAWGLRAEPVPRSKLGSWLLILSLLPGTWGQESWAPLSSCGERPGNTQLSPGILPSCLSVLCCPFLSGEMFFSCPAIQLSSSGERISHSFTPRTNDLPSSLVTQACMCHLKPQWSEQDIIHWPFRLCGFGHRTQVRPSGAGINRNSLRKVPNCRSKGNCWWPPCPPRA